MTRKKRGDEDPSGENRLASEPDADGYAPPTDVDPDAANAVDRAMRSLEMDAPEDAPCKVPMHGIVHRQRSTDSTTGLRHASKKMVDRSFVT